MRLARRASAVVALLALTACGSDAQQASPLVRSTDAELGALASALLPDLAGSEALGIGLLTLSFVTAATAYRRWARNEAAMRLGVPLAPSRLPAIMAVGTAVFVVIGAVLLVLSPT